MVVIDYSKGYRFKYDTRDMRKADPNEDLLIHTRKFEEAKRSITNFCERLHERKRERLAKKSRPWYQWLILK